MKKIVYILISLFFLTACDKEQEQDYKDIDPLLHFVMGNHSRVEIAVVIKGSNLHIPDSLVLFPGGIYLWSIEFPYALSDSEYDPVKVYFNKTTIVHYNGYPKEERDPRDIDAYMDRWMINGLDHHVYMFTEEDYQWALEQNNARK